MEEENRSNFDNNKEELDYKQKDNDQLMNDLKNFANTEVKFPPNFSNNENNIIKPPPAQRTTLPLRTIYHPHNLPPRPSKNSPFAW